VGGGGAEKKQHRVLVIGINLHYWMAMMSWLPKI